MLEASMLTPIASDILPGGKHWSLMLWRNSRLRLTDIEGGANVGMLFYNPINLLERYNAPDTLKCQHTFKLTAGHCLYSDMGRIFCSVVADTHGWHDTVCGNTTRELVTERWGGTNYQTERNNWQQNGHDSFLVEAAKYGLGRRDLVANVNWFSKVVASDDGSLALEEASAKAGASVELRFDMDTLVLLHTCAHPLNESDLYPAKPVRYEIFDGPPAAEADANRFSRPENVRGFENNRLYRIGCCERPQ
jgi:urea carboxylase-associated protein 2